MSTFNEFEMGFGEGYNQGYKKGYIAGIEDEQENEYLRPDDYCPLTTPYEEIMSIPCQNCAIEDRCDFSKSNEVYSGEEFWGEENLGCPDLDDEDFEEDDYQIELLYNTEQIQKIQEVIEEVAMISSHIGHIRSKCFQDKDTIEVLDSMRENVHNAIERLRELQEEAAIDEMYEFLVKNY